MGKVAKVTVFEVVRNAQLYILWAITFAAGVPAVIAFVHALTTRPDAFSAVDAQSKTFWVAMLGASTILIWLFNPAQTSIWILFLIGVVATMVYVVDVRVRVDEILNRSWFRKLG